MKLLGFKNTEHYLIANRANRAPDAIGPAILSQSHSTAPGCHSAPPAGTPPPPTGGLKKLKHLDLCATKVTDAGCVKLAAALSSGALPALEELELEGTRVSSAAMGAVNVALAWCPSKMSERCSAAIRRGVSQ